MLLLTGKVVFISILAGIFFGYFGYPSYIKYRTYDTVFTGTREKFDPQKPVGITIYAWKQTLLNGWKENEDLVLGLKKLCNESIDIKKVVQCINNRTYQHNDIIEKYTKMNIDKETEIETDITKDTFYVDDISVFFAGKSYTIKINFEEEDGYQFIIYFKPGQNYSVYFHDPNFSVFTLNPEVFPHIFLRMEDGQSQIIHLKTTYLTMMDKPKQRCEPSESYSFTSCIKNSISRMIGCRLEWDSWSSRDIPLCSMVIQLIRFEKEYEKLQTLWQSSIVKNTGCFIPCSYTKYKPATEPMKYEYGTQKLVVAFSSPDVLKRTEQLLYPLESFVSEFGGALGLFIGFSCMMIWDGLEILFLHCLKSSQYVET